MSSSKVLSVFSQGLFRNKTAIVTGGATGIGRAITQELIHLGCKVVIASRNTEKIENAVREIESELSTDGNRIDGFTCNIRKEEQVDSLFDFVLKKFGSCDFLVNNGGGQFISSASEINKKGWEAVIETNLTGTFHMCKTAYNKWMEKNGGKIVNITMDCGRGVPLMAHSGAARAGVENLTKSLAIEWAHSGVRINAVAPASGIYSKTAAANYQEGMFEHLIPHLPTKRLGLPEEISGTVCFLLSPAASLITGEILHVDGGTRLYTPLYWTIPEHDKLKPFDGKLKE